jgi:hypothetical protein
MPLKSNFLLLIEIFLFSNKGTAIGYRFFDLIDLELKTFLGLEPKKVNAAP